ncbi:1,2-phenylacetyl-CoA epoxidase subunit PaaD [Parahaliea mediterranea]|uniref:1,2-phenylacetyl-CoA epoxidase subunit PaaD n=1 Tax=Parahaliea mediterranea TaxID=651086 RepID=UPI001F4ED001|nr:1,2-phenylacetyl-CoA epoxidase subunit PaaD [Parahaliea mediterranea]
MNTQPCVSGSTIPLLPHEEYERRQRRAQSSHPELWCVLDAVKDPEIPVISIWELGVLQNIEREGETVVVTITPTYSGCPAMDVIREEIATALTTAGYGQHRVLTQLSPAWSSTWMDDDARARLQAYGIAAPVAGDVRSDPACPHCGSVEVRSISEFGSTACKALFQCLDCREPFDYFKSF